MMVMATIHDNFNRHNNLEGQMFSEEEEEEGGEGKEGTVVGEDNKGFVL